MALRDRIRSLLRPQPRPAAPVVAPEPAADVPARMARAVADPGTALVLDLAEVGMIGLSDVRAPHVVVTAPEPWRAAAAAELLQARGQSADWWEPGMEPT